MDDKLTPNSDGVIIELKKKIAQSNDIQKDEAKKILIWFIDQSKNASVSIALCIKNPELASDVQNGVHDMISVNGSTFIDTFFHDKGFLTRFYHHTGTFDDESNFFPKRSGSTIWITDKRYDSNAKIIRLDLDSYLEALKIDLKHYQ